jgi:hypothetical protein
MKTFEVTYRKESYLTYAVEAISEEDAEEKGMERLESEIDDHDLSHWEQDTIEEIKG